MKPDPAYAYKQGSYYENFMCRAYQTSDTTKTGMHGSAMQNLIDAENGQTLVDWLGSFDKQLIKVKGYMQKALDKFLQMKLAPSTLETLEEMKRRVAIARSTSELMLVVERTMEMTQSLKNY